jgi:hypothetical protein
LQKIFGTYKTTRAVSAAHNINTMKNTKKTSTGLHIKQKDKRIEVYTPSEQQKLRDKREFETDIVVGFTLAMLLIIIGILIGISI